MNKTGYWGVFNKCNEEDEILGKIYKTMTKANNEARKFW